MKTIAKYFLTGMILSFHISAFGQFNTLTPTLPKKTEEKIIQEKTKETDNKKQKKDKNFWKDIFNGTTKADLKNELDSLKTILKENSSADNKKWNRQKMQDSLILVAQSQLINHFQNNQKAFESKEFGNSGADDFAHGFEEADFSKISMPLNREISVTSPYGTRIHPIFGTAKLHNGIDLKAYYEEVYAVLDGIVTETGWDPRGGGHFIKIKHFNRFETAYLHLSEIYYRPGERVKAGFIIAKSGNTGNSTGPHLHFSVKEFGQNINPTRFLNDLTKTNHLMADYYKKGKNLYTQQ